MPLPICTIDASIVVGLDHLNLLPQLSLLFSRVLLPKAVRTELYRRRETKDRLQAILRAYAFIERCDDYDKGAVDVLLVDRVRQGFEDRGEAEAVIQAAKVGATVIVDDPWGRGLAKRVGREFHGTIWVMRRFYELGLVTGPVARSSFLRLLDRGIRLPVASINEFLVEIGESPIPLMHQA